MTADEPTETTMATELSYQTITDHTQVRPHDLLEYRCPRFGLVTQWRVVSVLIGAEKEQSLIEVMPVTKSTPRDTVLPFSVPEEMTRNLTIIRAGRKGDA